MKQHNRLRKKQRKAQVEVHFNWIFVLIVGAVILLFFLMIITRQKTVSNQRLASDVLADMELILTGQGVSVGREDLVAVPEIQLTFTCDEYGMMEMTRRFGNAIVFSPNSLQTEQLLTWTQAWDIPFKVSNFLYLTSPTVRYYLIFDQTNPDAETLAAELNNSLPEKMDKILIETQQIMVIEDEGSGGVRFVYLLLPEGTNPTMPTGFRDRDDKEVSALVIRKDPGSEDVYHGGSMLDFYKKQGSAFVRDSSESGVEGMYPAMGKEAVYGAIFSDDFDLYECSMEKAIRRLKYIAMIYNRRTTDLLITAMPRCATYYSVAPFSVFALLNAENLISGEQASQTVHELFAAGQALKNINLNTVRASCTTLY